ncbi:CTP synthase [Candidatus Berkelbacteria bacterium]|nr:CTP synthase [Candidatus Berkelbacteria bacterium]
MKHKYIFVVGGVMSGVGKGVSTASIGRILQARGYTVTAIKIDPYINVDAGTMNPTVHGETFVTNDADETDQDIGNYERFLDVDITSANYMTTGRVYQTVIQQERNLEYGGICVEVVPHIPEEVIRRITTATKQAKADITVIEVGGTIGEYQNILFLEAARMMKFATPKDVAIVLVSYLPIPKMTGEMKTKPTQYAARSLNNTGLQADFIICRAEQPIDEPRRQKLAMLCGIHPDAAVSAPDVTTVYQVPLILTEQELDLKLLKQLGLKPRTSDLKDWSELVTRIESVTRSVKIAIVGKYFGTGNYTLSDSYISVIEAIKHACWAHSVKPELTWIDAEIYEQQPDKVSELAQYDGVIVPGGFGARGIEGIITAIRYVREQSIPYLGLCYGMQLGTIEFARNVAGLDGAHTTEVDTNAVHKVIHIMPDQEKKLLKLEYGGTMRLGAYPAKLKARSIAARAYGEHESKSHFAKTSQDVDEPIRLVSERHRHRYEVNNAYRQQLESAGLVMSGTSPDGRLVEIIELPISKHPFFVGTQFHPEFKSRPLNPHPLFVAFASAAKLRAEH